MNQLPTSQLQLHPEAERIPAMKKDEYAAFLEDIKERGIRVPLEKIDGELIVDGRHRLRAAKELGLSSVPVVDAPLNGDDPVVYMLRAASRRRHLTDDQRSVLADEEREWLAAKGKERRKEKLIPGQPKSKKSSVVTDAAPTKPLPEKKSKKARKEAAQNHNVSERKVRTAGQVRKHSPQLAEQVKNGEKTLAQARREVERETKRKELEQKAKQAPKQKTTDWQIIHGDCMTELANVKEQARLIFADPPYNIGIDYGSGKKADQLPEEIYMQWARDWLALCRDKLTDDGSLWVMIGDEYAAEYAIALKHLGLHRRAWIKWYETFGVNQSNNFNRCSRHIFYCTKKHSKKFVFNAEAVNRLSDRQAKYNDKRADPGGKIWDDVWMIPRLVGTAKERIPDFPTQLPLAITRAIVGCASDPGDLVIDPFNGSGSTGAACIELKRRYIGIEKQQQFADLASKRLRGIQ